MRKIPLTPLLAAMVLFASSGCARGSTEPTTPPTPEPTTRQVVEVLQAPAEPETDASAADMPTRCARTPVTWSATPRTSEGVENQRSFRLSHPAFESPNAETARWLTDRVEEHANTIKDAFLTAHAAGKKMPRSLALRCEAQARHSPSAFLSVVCIANYDPEVPAALGVTTIVFELCTQEPRRVGLRDLCAPEVDCERTVAELVSQQVEERELAVVSEEVSVQEFEITPWGLVVHIENQLPSAQTLGVIPIRARDLQDVMKRDLLNDWKRR